MSLALVRLDDRLIHGQVVVGWGQPLNVQFIILVDDEVRDSAWEQDLYRMGVPSSIEVVFASIEEARRRIPDWETDPRVGILLAGDIDTMMALVAGGAVPRVNIGGIHHRAGRSERLRYVYLTDEEAAKLRRLASDGIVVTAQDVPTARAVPIGEFL
ncbi:MAG TPA: PTS sugar transporter subunit IIB [Gemmatimonadales bacterium]|jgi:PTS system mannose-specific IIB component/fructoselysine and glucoselysine-specific PTS system IIB component